MITLLSYDFGVVKVLTTAGPEPGRKASVVLTPGKRPAAFALVTGSQISRMLSRSRKHRLLVGSQPLPDATGTSVALKLKPDAGLPAVLQGSIVKTTDTWLSM